MSGMPGGATKWTLPATARSSPTTTSCSFPDDGKRHELIDGEHYVTPSPNIRHQDISGRLYLLIGGWLQGPSGRPHLLCTPLDVLFSRFDVV